MTCFQHRSLCLACLASLGWLAGCTSDSPRLDAQWGQSTRQAQTQQTAYPDAAFATRGPISTDAVATGLALQRYQRSFENPPPPVPVLQLGVGGMGSGAR